MKKTIASFFVLLFLLTPFSVNAKQSITTLPTVSPYPGMTFLGNMNDAFETFQTNFSGTSAPTSPKTYQLWVDETNSLLMAYSGSAWLPVARFSGNQWVAISNEIIGIIPPSSGSANAYIATYSPAPTSLVTGQHYPFIANFTNTGAATLNVNSLGAKALLKRGSTAVGANDINSGAVIDTVYDGTYFQIVSQLSSSGVGTVTSVATNNGITGGTITTIGTAGLAPIAATTLLANTSGSAAVPTSTTLSTLLDAVFSSTQGSMFQRGLSAWQTLAPGTSGKPLVSGGSGAIVSFTNVPVTSFNYGASASSTTYWRGDGVWATPAGTTGAYTSCSRVSSNTCSSGQTRLGGGCLVSSGEAVYNNYPSGSLAWVCTGSETPTTWVLCCQ